MKILFVEDNEEIRGLYGDIFTSLFQTSLQFASSLKEALELVSEGKWDLVLTDYHLGDGTAIELLKSLEESNQLYKNFVILSGEDLRVVESQLTDEEKEHALLLEKPVSKLGLSILKRFYHPPQKPSKFYQFPGKLFLFNSTLNTDLFIKLSEQKFVKIHEKSNPLDPEQILSYLIKNDGYLYLSAEDAEAFENQMIELSEAIIKKWEETQTNAEMIDDLTLIHQTIKNKLERTGLDTQVIKTGQNIAYKILKDLQKSSEFKTIFKFFTGKRGFIPEHSLMLCYISIEILKKCNWGSDFSYKALSNAAFFHDICTDEDSVSASKELEPEILSQDDPHLEHSIKAVNLLKPCREIPKATHSIIMNHHELPTGSGYPNRLKHQELSPLSLVFIIAHEIVMSLYKSNFSEQSFKVAIDQLQARFKDKTSRDILTALQ